jgi:hypothetical protein
MNKKILALSVVMLAIAAVFVGYLVFKTNPNSEEEKRGAAPGISGNATSSGFGNPMIEKAITDYLLTQRSFSWKTGEGSQNFCSVENLDPDKQLFPLYVWAFCREYKMEEGALEKLSGSSGPVRIDYPNELSFYDTRKFSHEAPRDGGYYTGDVKKIFPQDVQYAVFHFDRDNISRRNESEALAGISGWESIKKAVENCEAEKIWQTHDRTVKAELKRGSDLTGVEPELDDVFDLTRSAEQKCGRIIVGTE